MQKNRIRGPIITLAAVAALGGGLWLANSAQEVEPAAAPAPIVATTVDNTPNPPSPPSPPAPAQFRDGGLLRGDRDPHRHHHR